MHVNAELLGNLPVRPTCLPQFESDRATLGDCLRLAGAPATAALRGRRNPAGQ
jgi:hypothetical protein